MGCKDNVGRLTCMQSAYDENAMSPEFFSELHVILPMLGSVGLVGWVLVQRLREGIRARELLLDRQFMAAVFYTGALLTIYLSCAHYLHVAAGRPLGVMSP